VDELKKRLIDEWERFDQSIVNAATFLRWICCASTRCRLYTYSCTV